MSDERDEGTAFDPLAGLRSWLSDRPGAGGVGDRVERLRQVLTDPLADRLTGSLAGPLTDSLVGPLADRLAGLVADRLAEAAVDRLADRLAGTLADRLVERMAGPLVQQVVGEVTAQQAGRVAEELADPLTDRVAARFTAALDDRLAKEVQQLEAVFQLFRRVSPRAPMPTTGGWAMTPAALLELMYLVERRRPRLVLELGSGTSTVWMSYAVQRHQGRVVSLDHDQRYAAVTRAQLMRHRLERTAEVRYAPLREQRVGDRTYRWYDPTVLGEMSGVELLVVDGPPGVTGPMARYPALPLLEPLLADRATVVLDDADRPDERRTAERWQEELPGLARHLLGADRLAVWTYRRPAAP